MAKIQRKTSLAGLAIVLLLGSFIASFGYLGLSSISKPREILPNSQPVDVVDINGTRLAIPSWNLFKLGSTWSLVSANRNLPPNFTPETADSPVPFSGESMKIGAFTEKPLTGLVTKAKNDGVQLMLSSAYRSAEDQAKIYSAYQMMYGQAYADNYVAVTGASEHQTGLAVDLASLSSACKLDGNACSLDAKAIAWLRTNAPNFGFIERYPVGKQSITGVAGEHWHWRYVGAALAKALNDADMTLDEFVQQTAPGYTQNLN